MYCKYCGKQISDQSRFCHYCGNELKQSNQCVDEEDSALFENTSSIPTFYSQVSEKASENGRYTPYSGKFEKHDKKIIQGNYRKVTKKIVSVLLTIICLWGLIYSANPDNNLLSIRDMRKAYKYATQALEEKVLITKHEFPKFDSSFVNQRSKEIKYNGYTYRVYTVSAYVYAENIFGVSEKSNYVVEIGLPTETSVDGFYYNIVSYDGYSGY